jgi:hypothetical protein
MFSMRLPALLFRVSLVVGVLLVPFTPFAYAAKTGSLEGKITFKGKPVAKGKILFHPAKGKAIEAKIKADGTYAAKAVPAGKVRVSFKDVPGLPAKYSSPKTTPLVIEAKEGESIIDFALE